MINLLKLSQLKKEEKSHQAEVGLNKLVSNEKQPIESFLNGVNHIGLQDPMGRFFNSEYWKISSYLSTVIPTYFLSVFVSIIDHAQEDIKLLI